MWNKGRGAQCATSASGEGDFCKVHKAKNKGKSQNCKGCTSLLESGVFAVSSDGVVSGHAHGLVNTDGDKATFYHRFVWEHYGRVDCAAPANFTEVSFDESWAASSVEEAKNFLDELDEALVSRVSQWVSAVDCSSSLRFMAGELSASERAVMHKFAEAVGVESRSEGDAKARRFILSFPQRACVAVDSEVASSSVLANAAAASGSSDSAAAVAEEEVVAESAKSAGDDNKFTESTDNKPQFQGQDMDGLKGGRDSNTAASLKAKLNAKKKTKDADSINMSGEHGAKKFIKP